MKKLFFIYVTLATITGKSQPSVYHPFPDSGIVWREEFSGLGFNCCCQGICVRQDHYQYFLGGDTLIGTTMYKKILKTGYGVEGITGPPFCPPWCTSGDIYYYYANDYIGGMRQDTSQRKVFFIPPSSLQDTLLYDFNLTIGDTLPFSWNNFYPSNYVSSIDSILIGGDYHKRYWLSAAAGPTNYVSIMEGIGSNFGLLFQLSPPFEFLNNLVCVTINSIPVYPDSVTICLLPTEINEIENKISFSLFPNPFHSSAQITINTFLKNTELKIFDLPGRQVKSQILNSNNETLNRDNLPSGIYFFQINYKPGQMVKGKIIIE